MNRFTTRIVAALACTALLLVSLGCQHMQVVAMPNRDVAELSADDVTSLMREAGFSDQEILRYGTDLRNGLAMQGAARVYCGNRSQAIFAVYRPFVHVSAEGRRSFTYDLRTGETR